MILDLRAAKEVITIFMIKDPQTINEYISNFPESTQVALKQIRATIRETAPEAVEGISYKIAAFKYLDRVLIYFAGFKNHVSLYPAPREKEAFKAELESYKGGKGTIQFPLKEPLPLNLIKRIVKFRQEEILRKR